MQVSFIVPLFNRLDLTQALVASIGSTLPQGLDYEVILVDDGSTDGTREWISGLKAPFRPLLNPKNLGYAGANNRAASQARGALLLLINNDLVLQPGWLEPLLDEHRRLADAAGVIGNVQHRVVDGAVDHAGIEFDPKGKPRHVGILPRFGGFARTTAVTGACIAVSATLWTSLGGFDERYMNGCEDVDLCLRAAAAGKVNGVALRSVIGHHVSASPGRKRRDEANTCRLLLRWRETIEPLAARAWASEYFDRTIEDPRGFDSSASALRFLAFRMGLIEPPPEARVAARAAIDREFARWRDLGVLAEVEAHTP